VGYRQRPGAGNPQERPAVRSALLDPQVAQQPVERLLVGVVHFSSSLLQDPVPGQALLMACTVVTGTAMTPGVASAF
jgi:hypothetical protein